MINLKNDMVKKSRNRMIKKKIPAILALKKPGCYSYDLVEPLGW
jgi:hypothetical protein